MIVDKMANMHIYEKTIPQIKEIIPILDQAKDMEVGTYMYPWGKVMIQEGNTRHLGEGEFESHRKFIDVQCMLDGEELMEYGNIHDLTESVPYNEESDAMFWKGMGSVLEVPAGVFYIAFPEDGHKPCCHKIKRSHYKKMVIKIKAEKD
jgi:biofilm protein TabA